MPKEDKKQVAASREILVKNQAEKKPYRVNICGLEFIVQPGVFSPRYFNSTDIFSRNFPYRRDESFLEIGSGPGITSVLVALRGARSVVAVDINPKAVKNTQANALLHGVQNLVGVRVSDVFSSVSKHERFDTIYWNLPFIYVPANYSYRSVLERALYDPGYRYTQRFLRQAPRFLNKSGRLLVGFGDFGDMRTFFQLVGQVGYSIKELACESGQEGGTVSFILYELHLRKQTSNGARRKTRKR